MAKKHLAAARDPEMSVEDLAARLLHAGVPVAGISPKTERGEPRVLLRDGLSVLDTYHDRRHVYEVVLRHGFDPVTLDVHKLLARVDDPFALPDAIAQAQKDLPAARASLLGENRDFVGEMREKVYWELFTWVGAPPVVASEEPVPGAIAVSMKGRDMTAWFLGARMTSFFHVADAIRRCWRPDDLERATASAAGRYFPIEGDGLHLTAQPCGPGGVSVAGSVRTPSGDEWFHASYYRRGGERGSWSARHDEYIGSDLLHADERSRIEQRVGREIEPLYLREYDAFLLRQVEYKQIFVDFAREDVEKAGAGEGRRYALIRERACLGDLAEMQRRREMGRPRTLAEEDRDLAASIADEPRLGTLRAVPDLARDL